MQKIKGKQQWSQDEKKLLAGLFPKFSSKKWKMISIQMAQKGFKRTQLECREKWINFLDPNLNNQGWNSEELERLYNYHDKYGTRWCFMQKELNRTQNRIKNRFYGTIRNYIRLVMNTLCQKHTCFNAQINKISPSLLNDLYNSENVFDFLRGEIKKMVYRMKFKIDKKILRNRIREKQNLYRQLLGLIGSLFKGSFSLRFYDKIEKSQCDQDEQQNYEEESIKQIPKQLFAEGQKNIKKQNEEIKQLSQEQQQKSFSNQPMQNKNHFSLKKVAVKKNSDKQQSNENLKQHQYLYATSNNRKSDQQIINANKKGQPSLQHIYPFLNHNENEVTRQQWMMNHFYRNQYSYQQGFQFMIEKIRNRNLVLMMQQELFMNQMINQNHGHDISINNTFNGGSRHMQ